MAENEDPTPNAETPEYKPRIERMTAEEFASAKLGPDGDREVFLRVRSADLLLVDGICWKDREGTRVGKRLDENLEPVDG